jgi:alpha-methylacyl-CoA racemase
MASLAGLRILSLALNVPGPVAMARLVALGAAARKIEPPGGDPIATMAPSWYAALHQGVTVESLDLKSAAGQARLDTLLAASEVLITSHRPSSLDRLRLSPDALQARAPHLRSVAIVGDTADPEHAGHDVTYQAAAGLVGATLPPTLMADLAGAECVVTEVLLVLRDAPGARRVVGLRDALEPFAAPRRHGLTRPGGVLGGGLPAYGVYAAADGTVAIAALEPHFRARLYELLHLPDGAPIAEAIARWTVADLTAAARMTDVPIARVQPG